MHQMSEISALFFDLDGTLVDSELQHWKAWCAILRPLGITLPWQQYEEEAVGCSDLEILSVVTRRFSRRLTETATHDLLAAKRTKFCALIKQAPPVHPDTQKVLSLVAHLNVALVTSSTKMETCAILETASLSQYFKAIVCFEDVQNPKPHPEPYLVAMRRMKVRDGIAFEDSSAGRASARSAGLKVIEVSNPSEIFSIVRSNILPHVINIPPDVTP